MLKKLVYGAYKQSRENDRAEFIAEAERMINEYGWQEKTVSPYNHCHVKVTKIIDDLKDYDNCTAGSKEYLISLVNGLVDIMNAWEKLELSPKVRIRLANGIEKDVPESLANDYIECGFAVLV